MTQIVTPAAEFSNGEAAAYIGVTPGTLEVWRCRNRYRIPYLRIGRHIRYRRADLDKWLDSRRVGDAEAVHGSVNGSVNE